MTSKPLLLLLAVLAVLCITLVPFVSAQEGTEIKEEQFGKWQKGIEVGREAFSAPMFFKIPDKHTYAEIVVRMRAETQSANFDPDLYVGRNRLPGRDAGENDGSDLTIEDEHVVVFRSPEKNIVAGDYYQIAAYGFSQGTGTVEFLVEVNTCAHSNCNGERGKCLPPENGEGDFTCKCEPEFILDPYCSSELIPTEVNKVLTGKLDREQTAFYKFDTPTPPKEGYMRVTVKRTGNRGNGTTTIYIQKGSRPDSNHYQDVAFLYSFANEAIINIDARTYSAGTWYVSVGAPTRGTIEYSLEIEYFNCPRNCSGKGECDAQTSVCTCQKEYTLLPDCSIRSRQLHFAEPQSISLEPNDSIYFDVHVNKETFNMSAEIGFQLRALEVDPEKPPRGVTWPTMYLNYGATIPTPVSYMMTSPRPGSFNQTFYLPDSKVFEGHYTLAVVNEGFQSYEYDLTARVRPHCPFGCDNNGHCNPIGQCQCKQDFIGGSCDISSSKCDKIVGVTKGVSGFVLFMLVVIFSALAAAISIFVYTKFFYVESSQQAPELQYDPLNE